jgi:hypothetical protein
MEPILAQAPGIGAFGGVPEIDRQVKPLDLPTREQVEDPAGRRLFRVPDFWKKMSKFQQTLRLLFTFPGLLAIGFGMSQAFAPDYGPKWALAIIAYGLLVMLAAFVYKTDGALAEVASSLDKFFNRKPEGVPRDLPLRPWLADHPWVPEDMPQDFVKPWEPWTRSVSFLLLLLLHVVFLGGISRVTGLAPIFGLLLPLDLVAVPLILDTWRRIVWNQRFGEARVTWKTFPVLPGEPIEATIRTRRPFRVQSPVRITLRCVQDVWGTLPNGKMGYRPHQLYADTREVPLPVTAGQEVSAIDIGFDVPDDMPGTNLDAGEPVYWQLVLQTPNGPGPDLNATFLAPIYERRVHGIPTRKHEIEQEGETVRGGERGRERER